MIVFNLRLAVRSMRWLGPALLVAIWTLLAISDPGPALSNAANSFIMVVAVTCWLTITIGNVDDDGHRELVAAAIGSPGRLHRSRALSAYLGANVLGSVATVAAISVTTRPTRSISELCIVGSCVLLQLAATAIGVGIGTMLHRPVVRHAGFTLLVAAAALVGLILLAPVEYVLRQLNDGRTGGLVALTVVAGAAAIAAVGIAATLADRRN
jgi:hypothetical protein